MAGNQTDNLLLLDLTTGLSRTPELGGTPDTLQLSTDFELISGANMLVDGNLVVNGTTTTVHSEQVNINDNHLYLNADYTTTVAQTGGIVANVLPTATNDTVAAGGFTAGVPATSNPTVITTGSATFSAGDVIQVSGANDQSNDGIFEVESHVGTTLTIRGVGTVGATQDWMLNDFVTDSTVAGTITLVNVNVLRGTSSGDWETATTSTTTALTYNTFTAQGVVDLQEAYEQGNTITTDAGNGSVVIAGTELLSVTATGGIDLDTVFDADVSTFDVQMTGANGFSIDGTAASNVTVDAGDLTLSTTTSGNVVVNSVAALDVDAATTVTVDTADAADASGNDITVTAGSSTAGAADGASIVLTPGDGDITGVAGFVNITSPADEDEILLQIESTGTGANAAAFFTGTSDPSASVTADAGSLFLRDTGAGAVAYLNTSTGSGTTWTAFSTGAGNNLQQAYEAGNTIVTDTTNGDFDISGTEAISLDASSASNFTVDGADLVLSTTTSGELDLTSAGLMDVNAGAGLDIDVTGAFDTLSTGAFSVDGTGASNVTADAGDLTLSTTTSGSLLLDGQDGVEINSAGGALEIGNDADTGAINVGTGAAARTITVGNATGATAVNFDSGTGAFTFDSTVGGTTAVAIVTTTGADGDSVEWFVSDLDPSAGGGVAAPVGSTLWRDSGGAGTTGELWLKTGAAATAWEQVATGDTTETLQEAYEAGNTIVTDTTNGDFDVSGTEAISLDAQTASNFTVDGADLVLSTTTSGELDLTSAGLMDVNAGASLDIDVTGTFDMLSTGLFTIAGTGNSTVSATSGDLGLSTLVTGSVLVDGIDGIELNSGSGAINVGNDADTGAINVGTGAAARTITVGNSTGATGVVVDVGTGEFALNSTVGEADPIATLTTTGASGDSVELFVGDNDPSGSVTGLAGSLFMRDTGTTGELYINTSTGSGTAWTQVATGGSVTLQNAYEGGNTITTDTTNGDFDVSGTEAISLDASAASNFTVDGADLTLSTTTSGTVDITSADDIQMTFETNNATAMVIDDGTNNFVTFDSTTGELAVEVNEFMDIVGNGAGVTLTAGEAISAGDVVTIEGTSGDAILADADTGTTLDGLAIGVAAYGAVDTTPVKVYTVPGSLIPVNFSAAPAASLNGRPVFVSTTPGEGTTTAPTGSGNVVYLIGILQGADGADTSPLVLYQPQFIAVRP